jgi:hypothetical protein
VNKITFDYLKRKTAKTIYFEQKDKDTYLVLRNFDSETGEELDLVSVPIDAKELLKKANVLLETVETIKTILDDLSSWQEESPTHD